MIISGNGGFIINDKRIDNWSDENAWEIKNDNYVTTVSSYQGKILYNLDHNTFIGQVSNHWPFFDVEFHLPDVVLNVGDNDELKICPYISSYDQYSNARSAVIIMMVYILYLDLFRPYQLMNVVLNSMKQLYMQMILLKLMI